jgi:hypothetical protein
MGRSPHRRFRLLGPPGPDIAKPEGRQHVDHAFLGPPVVYADLYQQIRGRGLRVFHKDVEIPIFIEYAGVEQFVLGIGLAATPVGVYQIRIRICALRILIEIPHIRVGRRAVQVIIVFLDVLPVIGLAVGQPERPLLNYRVLAVPQRQRKTQPLVIVTETGETILTPVIGTRTGLVVAEIVPGVPVRAVVLSNSAPLAFTEVGSPLPPRYSLLQRFIQPLRLGRLGRFDSRSLGHDLLPTKQFSVGLSRRTRSDRTPRAAR